MPVTSGVFARIWKFIDHRQAGDDVTRQDLDTALDDFVPAVNSALSVLSAATTAKNAAEAAVINAEAVASVAGASAGAAAAEAAAAPLTAAASASAATATAKAAEAASYAALLNTTNFLGIATATYTGDLNSIATTSIYKLGVGVTNGPAGAGASDHLLHFQIDASNAIQEVFNFGGTEKRAYREKVTGTWGAWIAFVMASGDQTIAGAKTLTGAAAFSSTATFAALASFAEVSLGGGVVTASVNDGTKSGGTYTPTPAGGNFKHIVNGGAFTLAAPAVAGAYTILIEVTNNATAGAITFTGFAKVIGDTLTTVNTSKFQIGIAKTPAGVVATVVAMQ
jgi:hypothetical protein